MKLPADHGLKFEFDGEETTIESIPQDERYDLECSDTTHQLTFGQSDRVECDEMDDPSKKPTEITVKGCHKPCSVVS